MKKVGIMTLHIGDNYGALLQCYALRRILNNFPDVCADVINYDPGREFPCYGDAEIQKRYLEKLRKFEAFNKMYNGIMSPTFFDMEADNVPKYDYYITGSDQVWNTSFSFAKPAYFLDFVKGEAKKIAYAPSIGISVNSIKLKKEWFEKNIPSFAWLSLREMSYSPFLQQYTDKEIYPAVDPTLLLYASEYDDLCRKNEYSGEDYLLLYFLKHDKSAPLLISFANMLSRKYHLKVLYSFVKVPKRVFAMESESFYFSGPAEFVQLVKNAKIVVTNSFHGTIFSLLYHRPFFTYLVSTMKARVVDLLRETDMEDRIVYGYRRMTDDMLDIDFGKADSVIEEKRKVSIDFLKKALDITN